MEHQHDRIILHRPGTEGPPQAQAEGRTRCRRCAGGGPRARAPARRPARPRAPAEGQAPQPGEINLAPKAEARACRYGTKQAILVDLLFRSGGASVAELREALAPWKDITIKSGLGDMNHQKGYGIRTTHENGYQRWLATDCAGMGTFRGDSHPDDCTEAEKAALLADNLANGYNPGEVFAVYHLVLAAGMTAPVPHTGGKE